MTRVSVVIPAFRAAAMLGRALDSVSRCGWPERDVEIIVAPDDGHSYASFAAGWGRRIILPPGPVASGPGRVRNRALIAASGDLVAFLDADDTWAPGFLAALVPLANTHGLAFGRTEVRDGATRMMVSPRGNWLGFPELGSGTSFHPVLRRDWAGPFASAPSQDVFHAVEVVALAGGRAPVGAACYCLYLRAGSTTGAADYSAQVATAYAGYARAIRAGATRVPAALRHAAAGVFDRRAEINAAFVAEGSGQRFYDFLAARVPA